MSYHVVITLEWITWIMQIGMLLAHNQYLLPTMKSLHYPHPLIQQDAWAANSPKQQNTIHNEWD